MQGTRRSLAATAGPEHAPARYRLAALAAAFICAAMPAAALPPAEADPVALMAAGQPVSSIPAAGGVTEFQTLDDAHVVLSTGAETHYLLTLGQDCVGLRWARHVGVTASDDTIWAGFDALTADGEACPIQAIHRVTEPASGEL